MGKVMIFDHPLIQHKVSLMRDKNTTSKEFRDLAREVAMLMTYEITRDLKRGRDRDSDLPCKGADPGRQEACHSAYPKSGPRLR